VPKPYDADDLVRTICIIAPPPPKASAGKPFTVHFEFARGRAPE
jgi:hypothetical protein